MYRKTAYVRGVAALLAALLCGGCRLSRMPETDGGNLVPAAETAQPAPADTRDVFIEETWVATGAAEWRYLEAPDVEALPEAEHAAWAALDYDDSAWKRAAGSFGAKDGALQKLSEDYLPDHLLKQYAEGSDASLPVYWFRTAFDVADATAVDLLEGELTYDDAVVVYLNGLRIYEGNVPEAGYKRPDDYGALEGVGSPRKDVFRVSGDCLLDGRNVLAVEVHQAGPDSSDVYFDWLRLRSAKPEITSVFLGVGGDETSVGLTWRYEGRTVRDATVEVYASAAATETPVDAVLTGITECDTGDSYRVQVTGLTPNTAYSYRIRCGKAQCTGTFETSGSADGTDILLLGDPQLGSGSMTADEAAAQMKKYLRSVAGPIDFIMCLGDVSVDAKDAEAYRLAVDAFGVLGIPAATVIGNHDDDEPYLSDVIVLPNMTSFAAEAADGDMSGDYWFGYGGSLFFCLNSNNDDPAVHEEFLREAETAYAAQAGEPLWRVVYMHHSPYSNGDHEDAAAMIAMRPVFGKLFSEANIDVVISGHDHSYSRSYLVEDGEIITYQGEFARRANGQVLYLTLNSCSGSKFYDLGERQPYTAFCKQTYRAMLTTAHITPEQISFLTWDPEREETIDIFTLAREE